MSGTVFFNTFIGDSRRKMKKYTSLGELLVDYRNYHDLTQMDLAERLEVDSRTVGRWEKNTTLVHPEKEKYFVNNLSLPHQVVHNLNSERPLAIYYDMERRMYSHSALGSAITSMSFFKEEYPIEEERFRSMQGKEDADFISLIKNSDTKGPGISTDMIFRIHERLPQINFMVIDQSGFYAGYSCVIPLKRTVYESLRSRKIMEDEIDLNDVALSNNEDRVFYLYSLYADSVPNAYYVLHRLFNYFKENRFSNYLVCGMVYRDLGVNLFRESGLKALWTETKPYHHTLMEGDFDMYLFGQMN